MLFPLVVGLSLLLDSGSDSLAAPVVVAATLAVAAFVAGEWRACALPLVWVAIGIPADVVILVAGLQPTHNDWVGVTIPALGAAAYGIPLVALGVFARKFRTRISRGGEAGLEPS